MKQHAIFNQTFGKLLLGTLLIVGGFIGTTFAQGTPPAATTVTSQPNQYCKNVAVSGVLPQCCDGIDNNSDGKADYYGVDFNGDGVLDMEQDPSCLSMKESTASDGVSEATDDVAKGSLVPCTDKCTLVDVFTLINNLINFFFKVILIPLFVVMIMYAGFRYLMAQGNAREHVRLRTMAKHLVGGLIIMLLAWLIVNVILTTVGYSDKVLFFS